MNAQADDRHIQQAKMEGWLENKNMSLEVNVYNVIAIAATEALVSWEDTVIPEENPPISCK